MGGVARAVAGVLLAAVAVVAVMGAVRLAVRAPSAAPPASPPATASATAPPSRPTASAASELLARIQACSEPELEAVIDRMSPLEALGLYGRIAPADRVTVLSAVPAPLLARKAQALLGLPDAAFRHARQPGRLASSLIDAALGAPAPAGGTPPLPLTFATALDAQHAPSDARRIFRPAERRIYACVDGGDDPLALPGVLMRWSVEGSGALLHVQYLPLAQNRRWNHVYYEAPAGWPAGTYRVSLFRVEEVARLLAEGTFTVQQGD